MNKEEVGERGKQAENDYCQKRLTLLLLTWEFPPHIVGGLARHTEGLSLYLQKNGVEVHVITAKTPHIDNEFAEVEGVKVYRIDPLNANDNQFLNWIGGLNLEMVQKALELANEHQYHMIHAHDWLVGEAALTISNVLKLPLVTTIHATEYGRNSGIFTELQQFIHNKENQLVHCSNHIIVCSDYMKEEVSSIFTVREEKISIIPNGVRIEMENNRSSNNLHPFLEREERSIIFSIGRLVMEKGFDLLIEAAAKIKRRDICFVIAGIGPMYHEYERLIKRYELEESVYLVGFISDQQRNQFFEHCTMAIFPSRYEPFGIVTLEAMKFSKPIIVTEIGGLRGINIHRETGLFMENNKVDSLIKQIEFILSNPVEAKRMAVNGKKLVDHFYSWQRVAEMTRRVYEELYRVSTINKE
jgi:1,4-alpha-glucan branching enzyme